MKNFSYAGLLVCAGLASLTAVAKPLSVGLLEPGAFADIEVSTNLPFVVNCESMNRIRFVVSLEASPSNCVEIAIGTDRDHDGNLSIDEAEHVFGYDCCKWFSRQTSNDEFKEAPCVVSGRVEREFVLKSRFLDVAWNLVKVTRRGGGGCGELMSVAGEKPGTALIVR